MEGDLLIAAMGSSRSGKLAIAAGILSITIAVAMGGCGKKDAPAPQGNVPASQAAPGGIPAGAPAGQGEVSVTAGDGFKVVVAPSTPSRIAPPAVSLKSPPGKGAAITSVRWRIDGIEREHGEILAPLRFQRGDRIQAVVVLRAGGGETTVTTPEVVAVNALPAVTDVRLEPQAPISGSEVRAVAVARDPDGDPLTLKYQWHVDNVVMPGGGDSLTLKGVRKGSWVHVEVTPNDGFADGAWTSSSRYRVVNAPPVVIGKPPTTIPPSRVLSHSIVAEDPDGDPLTYTLVKGPEGATLSGATFTWKVNDRELDRLAEVVIRISDTDGASTVLTMALNPRKP